MARISIPLRGRPCTGPALALAILLLLPGLVGCGAMAWRGAEDPFGGRDGPAGTVTMEVQNQLNEEVVVRIRGGEVGRDLGRVPSRSNQRFSFPWPEFDRLTIQLEAFSGARHTLPPVAVGAGEVLELVVQSPLDRSVLRR